MIDEKYTRCPGCSTIFRVSPEQLAIRSGQVRCGHCRTVFDGIQAVVSLAPQQVPAMESPDYDAITMGPATVTLRSAQALQPVADEQAAAAAHEQDAADEVSAEVPTESPGDVPDDVLAEMSPPADPEAAYASRFAWQEQTKRRVVPTWVYAVAIPLLVLLFCGQAAFHFRDAIVAHWPVARPVFARVCAYVGCDLNPLQEISALSIEASDLQADPAHRGLLVFSATIRNLAPYSMAFPMVELTLVDSQEQVVVRRDFSPQEYVNGTVDALGGISGNSELAVKLFIDASATTQAGYKVGLFYP